MTTRRAAHSDFERIESLLRHAHLPVDGAREAFEVGFVAEDGDAIVGAVALEVFPDTALLRSLVVDGAARGQGVGQRLTSAAIAEAHLRGLASIYLLTTTAETFFPRFGFVVVDRQSVPASIQSSIEFQSACPASAIAMGLRRS